jgi:cholesterol oxidase
MAAVDYDIVVIGSGFGGSVAAFRAAEKGSGWG